MLKKLADWLYKSRNRGRAYQAFFASAFIGLFTYVCLLLPTDGGYYDEFGVLQPQLPLEQLIAAILGFANSAGLAIAGFWHIYQLLKERQDKAE